jgi:hypothetical protein
MGPLFLILAGLNTLALIATAFFGMLSFFGGLGAELYVTHFTLGLFTALLTLLVHCIIFTYFLGTGRWVKEVALAYQLPDAEFYKKTRELKRSSFPPALTAMLVTIATAAGGAGQALQEWPWFVHACLALAAFLVNLWAFHVEYRDVSANALVLDSVLAEVDRIRAARGLPTNAEALRQERS